MYIGNEFDNDIYCIFATNMQSLQSFDVSLGKVLTLSKIYSSAFIESCMHVGWTGKHK